MTPYRVIFESPLELSAQGELGWPAAGGVSAGVGGCPRGVGGGVPEAGLSAPSPLLPQGSR